jgi:hypothetical protein
LSTVETAFHIILLEYSELILQNRLVDEEFGLTDDQIHALQKMDMDELVESHHQTHIGSELALRLSNKSSAKKKSESSRPSKRSPS